MIQIDVLYVDFALAWCYVTYLITITRLMQKTDHFSRVWMYMGIYVFAYYMGGHSPYSPPPLHHHLTTIIFLRAFW